MPSGQPTRFDTRSCGLKSICLKNCRRGGPSTTETTSVKLACNIADEVNTSESVKSAPNIGGEVNIRLSKQMRDILVFLYIYRGHVHQQVEIISNIYSEDTYLTLSRIASMSRSIKVLMKAKLVASRKAYYSTQFSCWFSQRVCFFITEAGERFVEENLKENALMVKT